MPIDKLPNPDGEKLLLSTREGLSRTSEHLMGIDGNILYCTSIGQFRSVVRDVIRQWSDMIAYDILFISLDGLSGSGKSSLALNIRALVDQIASVVFYELPIDLFISTPRDSPLRAHIADSKELFWQFVYSRHALIDVASCIGREPGAAQSIPQQALYDRPSGDVKPGVIEVPAGKKVVLIDGIDSTRLLQRLSHMVSCPQLRIFVDVRPEVAMERAIRRDTRAGRRTRVENREYRICEFRHLIPQLHGKNVWNVDLMYAEQS